MVRDGIEQICSCLVDLIHQRWVAMGEEQRLLLQLGKVSEKGGRQDRKKPVLPIGRTGKCMVYVKHTKAHVCMPCKMHQLSLFPKERLSCWIFTFYAPVSLQPELKKLKLKEKKPKISFTQHFLPKEDCVSKQNCSKSYWVLEVITSSVTWNFQHKSFIKHTIIHCLSMSILPTLCWLSQMQPAGRNNLKSIEKQKWMGKTKLKA